MSGHHHHHEATTGDRRVLGAVVLNGVLTVAQIVGGIAAGSLSLIADALHNFSDAISLVIAFAARKIARRPADDAMTFGYVRAEIIAALINYTTLIIVGLYLAYEAVLRFVEPHPVDGWIVVIVASVALAVDAVTALMTYALSRKSMNIRAAFLHNLADALGSLGVIVAGTVIILFDWPIIDPIVTLLISGYVLWLAFAEIGGSIRMLMLGTPPDLDLNTLIESLREVEGVEDLHHVHAWAIDEDSIALEAHIIVADETGGGDDAVRRRIKAMVGDRFGIRHTTLEIERPSAACEEEARIIGHHIGMASHDHADQRE
jgi:cobalt-zinc-cadmium efflux system protein